MGLHEEEGQDSNLRISAVEKNCVATRPITPNTQDADEEHHLHTIIRLSTGSSSPLVKPQNVVYCAKTTGTPTPSSGSSGIWASATAASAISSSSG